MQQPTIADLKNVIGLSDLPEEHLQWFLDHGEYREYEDGTPMYKLGEPIDDMLIVLEGRSSFYMDVNGRPVFFGNFENDNTTGGLAGLLPYSRLKTSPGNSYSVGHIRVLLINRKHFHEMEQLNPAFIQRCIGYMTERARYFATFQLQQEKVSALGKLSAGIAHELNNPASAINRISAELKKRLIQNFDLTDKLLAHNVSPKHIQDIRLMIISRETSSNGKTRLSALKRIDAEDEIIDWLEDHGLGKKLIPEIFVDAGFNSGDLENIRIMVGDVSIGDVLQWLENFLSSVRTVKDMEDASSRISGLVNAIKSHVHMDRTNEMQPTELHNDLENTLTLLGYKLREKNIKVIRDFSNDLPVLNAFIGELNQVWMNLIDNAIYAMGESGQLTLKTCYSKKHIEIKIIDNGPGIPPEIKSKIFDPFFTTKKVGEGTGIGLDLVTRIIKRHDGEIKLFSEPGKTEFTICLPYSAEKTGG